MGVRFEQADMTVYMQSMKRRSRAHQSIRPSVHRSESPKRRTKAAPSIRQRSYGHPSKTTVAFKPFFLRFSMMLDVRTHLDVVEVRLQHAHVLGVGDEPVERREVFSLSEPALRWGDGVGACAWRRGFSAMARRGDGVPAMAWRSTVRHRAGGHATDAPGHQANVAATAQTRGKKQGRRERASCPAPRRPGRSREWPPSRGQRSRRPAD